MKYITRMANQVREAFLESNRNDNPVDHYSMNMGIILGYMKAQNDMVELARLEARAQEEIDQPLTAKVCTKLADAMAEMPTPTDEDVLQEAPTDSEEKSGAEQ